MSECLILLASEDEGSTWRSLSSFVWTGVTVRQFDRARLTWLSHQYNFNEVACLDGQRHRKPKCALFLSI